MLLIPMLRPTASLSKKSIWNCWPAGGAQCWYQAHQSSSVLIPIPSTRPYFLEAATLAHECHRTRIRLSVGRIFLCSRSSCLLKTPSLSACYYLSTVPIAPNSVFVELVLVCLNKSPTLRLIFLWQVHHEQVPKSFTESLPAIHHFFQYTFPIVNPPSEHVTRHCTLPISQSFFSKQPHRKNLVRSSKPRLFLCLLNPPKTNLSPRKKCRKQPSSPLTPST